MDVVENVKKVIQELILPEIGTIKEEYKEIKSILDGTNQRIDSTNKRLDDINTHLVDQSRRIDETNKRIDKTNKRIDELGNGLNARIDDLRVELRDEILKTNVRMDRLYEVIVRREEHNVLEMRIVKVEQMIEGMKEELLKLAA